MSKETQAKLFLIKAKIYKWVAIASLVIGTGIFLALYITQLEGDIMLALHQPAFIIMMVFPFLPAIVFSFFSNSAQKKADVLLEQIAAETQKAAA